MNIEFYKEYIRNHGHHYSGWYKRMLFNTTPSLFFDFSMKRFDAIGIYCNEGGLHGRDCVPMVILNDEIHPGEDCIPITDLRKEDLEVIEYAMLQGDKGSED